MLLSKEYPMTFRGKPATLRVIRNNAHCWAELSAGGESFSISTRADHYDDDDDDAAEAFKRAARNPRCVAPSLLMDPPKPQQDPAPDSLTVQVLRLVEALDNALLDDLKAARAALTAHAEDQGMKASERLLAKRLRAIIRTE
jgi:hypothetical protein